MSMSQELQVLADEGYGSLAELQADIKKYETILSGYSGAKACGKSKRARKRLIELQTALLQYNAAIARSQTSDQVEHIMSSRGAFFLHISHCVLCMM